MSKNIVITGASRGVGYQAALHLAGKGHQVIAVARTRERLLQLEERESSITACPADLTSQQDLDNLVQTIKSSFAPLDILIHCAGTLVNKSFDKLDTSDWNQMLDVNLMAPIQLTQRVLPVLADPSHIVNISSMGGYQGSAKFPGLTAYSVAKGGLSILTECLSAELASENISCNALCLGMVQTEMLEEAFPGVEAPVTASQMGKYVGNFALEGHTLYNGQILPVARQDPS